VLIRALEPLEGIDLMQRRRSPRRAVSVDGLCRGPGNLTKALGISLAQNRLPLTAPPLSIEDWGVPVGEVSWGPRIGIRVGTERPWRCWLAGHASVSGRRTFTSA
jgi:DNA-3-methyladenine glycosylase